MGRQIVFATNNKHKLEEISNILGNTIQLLSLNDIGFKGEIPEDYDTLKLNAQQKAFYIFNKYNIDCFADDTGLEVEALNGRPGVYSARYSFNELPNIPESERAQANVEKLLRELEGQQNRMAAFKTVICFIENNTPLFFEGHVEGSIIEKQTGYKGFGYDPVFVPKGYAKTFAEMDLMEKNKISHRALATAKFVNHLLFNK